MSKFCKYPGFATDCIQLYEIPPRFRHINLNQEEVVAASHNKSDFIEKNNKLIFFFKKCGNKLIFRSRNQLAIINEFFYHDFFQK